MSLSTAEKTVLSLIFLDGGRPISNLLIAAQTESSLSEYDVTPPVLPAYIDWENSDNIKVIEKPSDMNNTSPIIVYTGGEKTLPPILLMEETQYEIKLTTTCHIDEEHKLKYLKDNKDQIQLTTSFFEEGNIYRLNFKSYVGKGRFDIYFGNKRLEIPFEVRSKKIEYWSDYPIMLQDIAEFSVSLLLDRKSPLYQNYSLTNKTRSNYYEDFLLLDYLFDKKKLSEHYEYIRHKPHSEICKEHREELAGVAASIDPSSLVSFVCGDNLSIRDEGCIAGKYDPIKVTTPFFYETYDLPENRLIKDLLMTIRRMIARLDVQNKKLEESKRSSYIENRLEQMRYLADDWLSDKWLLDVGDLNYIPFESTILGMREGYRQLFLIYLMIDTGITIEMEDLPELLEGHNTKLYQVYEYWCYVRLFNCLSDLSSNKPVLEPNKKGGDKGWSSSIKNRPAKFEIPIDGTYLSIELYFNRNYTQQNETFRSYSIRLRPDYTLLIRKTGEAEPVYIINFDAKYKAKPIRPDEASVDDSKINSDWWEYDIYKMHTYRDALMKSYGSYILFPGKNDDLYVKANEEYWNDRNNRIIPSVGAIPLVPGDKADCTLRTYLINIFKKLVAYSEGTFIIGT